MSGLTPIKVYRHKLPALRTKTSLMGAAYLRRARATRTPRAPPTSARKQDMCLLPPILAGPPAKVRHKHHATTMPDWGPRAEPDGLHMLASAMRGERVRPLYHMKWDKAGQPTKYMESAMSLQSARMTPSVRFLLPPDGARSFHSTPSISPSSLMHVPVMVSIPNIYNYMKVVRRKPNMEWLDRPSNVKDALHLHKGKHPAGRFARPTCSCFCRHGSQHKEDVQYRDYKRWAADKQDVEKRKEELKADSTTVAGEHLYEKFPSLLVAEAAKFMSRKALLRFFRAYRAAETILQAQITNMEARVAREKEIMELIHAENEKMFRKLEHEEDWYHSQVMGLEERYVQLSKLAHAKKQHLAQISPLDVKPGRSETELLIYKEQCQIATLKERITEVQQQAKRDKMEYDKQVALHQEIKSSKDIPNLRALLEKTKQEGEQELQRLSKLFESQLNGLRQKCDFDRELPVDKSYDEALSQVDPYWIVLNQVNKFHGEYSYICDGDITALEDEIRQLERDIRELTDSRNEEQDKWERRLDVKLNLRGMSDQAPCTPGRDLELNVPLREPKG